MPSCARYLPTSRLKRMMTSATMLAQISWRLPSTWLVKSPLWKAMRSATLLSAAFSPATLTATSSMSQPLISFAPSSAAVMAVIPLPQPTSSTESSGVMYFSSSSMHSLVVSWFRCQTPYPD